MLLIDPKTGEVFDTGPRRLRLPHPWDKTGFLQMSQAAMWEIAKDREIGLEANRVFHALCALLDFENLLLISQSELARELGMRQGNVARAMKVLEEKGIIIVGPKSGRNRTYRLNPNYGWKGRVKNLRTAQREHLKLVADNTFRDPRTVDLFTGRTDSE